MVRHWRKAAVAGVAVGALTLAGCTGEPAPYKVDTSGLASFYGQSVRWTACPPARGEPAAPLLARRQCAKVRVPLDYRDADAGGIQLALSRLPAAEPKRRIGSLLVNPGGPGGGKELAMRSAAAHPSLLGRFDWVTYDPRGVGESSPVRCLEGPQAAAMVSDGTLPRTPAQWQQAGKDAATFAQACRQRSGRIASLIGVANSARDLDVIRAALREDKLRFMATSYGGQIAVTYAELFPAKVGRMVLNSPGNPTKTQKQVLLEQAAGFEHSFGRFVDSCVAAPPCPLGRDRRTALARFDTLMKQLEARPLPTLQKLPLTAAVANTAVVSSLADSAQWSPLATALDAAASGRPDPLARLADGLLGHRGDGTFDSFIAANTVINCLDNPDRHTVDQIRGMAPEFTRVSPRFGVRTSLRMLECAGWPASEGRVPARKPATGSPVLVLGNTNDPEAPLASVRQVAGLFRSSALIVNAADGHGAYGAGSLCVDRPTDAYLLGGSAPAREIHCA